MASASVYELGRPAVIVGNSMAADAFTVRMRARMDSAATAQQNAAQFSQNRAMIDREPARFPSELIELLHISEFGAEGDEFFFNVTIHGGAEAQKRIAAAVPGPVSPLSAWRTWAVLGRTAGSLASSTSPHNATRIAEISMV